MSARKPVRTRREFLSDTARTAATAGALTAWGRQAWAREQRRDDGRPPNLVWIWCDNLAYGDLGCYGNERAHTPNIDRLADQGARFTQYYIAHTVCSPSRAGLLTGRQPWRTGIVDVLRPDGPSGLPDDEITLGAALKERGYATAAFGKWHLGDRREFLPLQHGFDHWYGLPYSMDMRPTLLYRDNEIAERLPGDGVQDVTTRLTDDAIDFMRGHQEEPFFLYFSHPIPHPPLNIPERCRRPDRNIYEDAVSYMDEQTGRILDALDELGLADNTIVAFSSDNGPMGKYGETAGLRGGIRDAYEGGIRVPLVMRYPGHIPAGGTVDTPAIAYDIFPTFLGRAGGAVPDDRVYDGIDIWPLCTGAGAVERDEPMVWVYFDNVTTVREGDWKLHVGHRNKRLDPPELYNLAEDPQETTPVNDAHPNELARLAKYATAYEKEVPKVWSLQYPVRDPAKRPSGVRRE
ncbi:MAG: sulfatase-like hydrolase/transferase [Candidatus Hydrogenedentota bacterium]